MKKFLFLILLSVKLIGNNYAQDHFYYLESGRKIPLNVTNEKILVKFKDQVNLNQKSDIINRANKKGKLTTNSLNLKSAGNVHSAPDIVMLERNSEIADIDTVINELRLDQNIEYANHFFKHSDGTYQGVTDQFIIRLKPSTSLQELDLLLKEFNCYINKQDPYFSDIYLIKAKKSSGPNALQIANKFYETGLFTFCEPDFYLILKNFTSDPHYGDQWGLKNTGQYPGSTIGADINVESAWTIATGTGIKVAVIDEGVDLSHPDLNVISGYDATGRGSNGGPENDDAHGTSCAGIIGARQNNIGVVGIAYNCQIMPVRVAYEDGFGNWVSSVYTLADGINWAVSHGADILSNSWGGGSPNSFITNAINNAVTNGRGLKGCPVIFSAGNYNTSISYPAYLPNAIAVGAMSMCNQRKRSSNLSSEVNTDVSTDPAGVSCDGEKWWGSNFGPELDVVAPGVKIPTTDITGPAGYDKKNYNASYGTDYSDHFNGTSSACPHVAGIMALILSANPNLTAAAARGALERSCDKVGGYTYDASGHNNEMGFGRVNAQKALLAINELSSDFIANVTSVSPGGSVQFTDKSTGLPTSWSWSFSGGTPSSSTNQNPSVKYNSSGFFDVTLTVSDGKTTKTTTKNQYIIVGGTPSSLFANFSASSTSIKTGESVNFTDNSVGTPMPDRWEWSFPGGIPNSSTTQNPSNIKYNNAGKYPVTLKVYNLAGNDSETKTDYINVGQPASNCISTASLPPSNTQACYKEFISDNDFHWTYYLSQSPLYNKVGWTIISNGSGLPTHTYNYFFREEFSHPSFVNSQITQIKFTFQIEWDSQSTTQWADALVILQPSGCESVSWGSSTAEYQSLESCLYSTAKVITSMTVGQSEGVKTVTAIIDGTSNVKLSDLLQSSNKFIIGFIDNGSGIITIKSMNTEVTYNSAPVANFTASATSTEKCKSVNFTDASTKCPTSWNWTFEGGTPATSTLQNPTVAYLTPGYYRVTLVATNQYGSNTKTIANYITVTNGYVANAGTDKSICPGLNTSIGGNPTISGGTPPYTYKWTPSNNLSTTSIPNPLANPTSTTTYTVSVTDVNGCTSSDNVIVNVTNLYVNAGTDKLTCPGVGTQLGVTVGSGTGPYTYSWIPSTGLSSNSIYNPIASPFQTTDYVVTVRDANG